MSSVTIAQWMNNLSDHHCYQKKVLLTIFSEVYLFTPVPEAVLVPCDLCDINKRFFSRPCQLPLRQNKREYSRFFPTNVSTSFCSTLDKTMRNKACFFLAIGPISDLTHSFAVLLVTKKQEKKRTYYPRPAAAHNFASCLLGKTPSKCELC